jgi:hypothetical protein
MTRSTPARRHAVVAAALLGALALGAPRVHATDGWQPVGGAVSAPTAFSWGQVWGKVAVSDDGQHVAVAWATEVGHNVKLRLFDGDGVATSVELLANEGFTDHRQDEPMLAMDADKNTFVCWSDRKGHDGDGMGVFGRVYDVAGVALGPAFVISQGTLQSQWEPMPVALPGGGWLVAFNGEDDGEAWFRRLTVDGTPTTPDVNMATFHNNAQVDAALSVDGAGVVFTCFVDYGGNGVPGSGTNVFVRRFLPDGTPLDAFESLAHPSADLFDQIDPRMASNGLLGADTVHWIVWQDGGNDGDGQGIFARRFGSNGAGLGPAFQVNTTTTGDQLLPEVDCDHLGYAFITWEDRSSGEGQIVARHYAPDGTALSGELAVNLGAGDHVRPQVRMDPAGETVLFAYEGPGPAMDPNPWEDTDPFLVRWERPALVPDGPAAIGTTLTLDHDLPGGDGLFRVTLASFGSAGVSLPDGRELSLGLDVLFDHSLAFPDNGLPFVGFQAVVPVGGRDSASVVIPSNPLVIGVPMRFAALTLDLAQPGLALQLRHVTQGLTLVLE